MTTAPQHVMASWALNVLTTDMNSVAAAVKQPLLLNAAAPRDVALLWQQAPQLMLGQTVGSGHFIQLEVPDQVNAMIERFLAVKVTAAA